MKSYNYTKELRKKENDKADSTSYEGQKKNDETDKTLESDNECKEGSSDDECKAFIKSVIGPVRKSREDDYIYSQNQTRKQTNKQTNKTTKNNL